MVITTSNIHNPHGYWQHKRSIHFMSIMEFIPIWWKVAWCFAFGPKMCKKIILEHAPQIVEPFISQLVTNTRGLEDYENYPDSEFLSSDGEKFLLFRKSLAIQWEPYWDLGWETCTAFESMLKWRARHHFMTESIPGFIMNTTGPPEQGWAARFLNKLIRLFPSASP